MRSNERAFHLSGDIRIINNRHGHVSKSMNLFSECYSWPQGMLKLVGNSIELFFRDWPGASTGCNVIFSTSSSHFSAPGTSRNENLLVTSVFLLEHWFSDSNIRLIIQLCMIILWLWKILHYWSFHRQNTSSLSWHYL